MYWVYSMFCGPGLSGAGHGEEEVAGAGFADGGGGEAAADVVVVDGFEVGAFEAEVEEAGRRGLWR